MTSHAPWLRDFEAGRRLDLMLVAAVAAILSIRFFLAVAGYPKLGGDSLHIAHMFWGGLLMLGGIVILLSFIGRTPKQWGAFLGGLGFGTFIDEIGKFVTHDNDYFYQPAVALIYASLVLIYLAARSIHRRQPAASGEEHLANALQEVTEVIRGDLDGHEQARALRHLEGADQEGHITRSLREILMQAEIAPEPRAGLITRILQAAVSSYRRLAEGRWFVRGIVGFFMLRFLLDLGRLAVLVRLLPVGGERWLTVPLVSTLPPDTASYTAVQWLQFGSGILSWVFIALGALSIFGNRLLGLRRFQQSVLVSLLLTQVFVFYQIEWLGLLGLGLNLLVFAALRFMIEQEEDREAKPA